MKERNRGKKDWFGYLMNFVAVCLGIVITFAGQGLINRHAERNEVKSRLQMLHDSSDVKATIANTIASIDKYIQ